MPNRKKKPTERIEVIDQVGKRHVVLRYTEYLESTPEEGDAGKRELVATEYRLASGRSVCETGEGTFQTTDGLLHLKIP